MAQGLSSPERNSKILWINLEFLKAFCVYRNSRIPYRDPHRYPPRGLRDDIVRNSRISRLNLEFLNLEFLEAFCVYRNSRIPSLKNTPAPPKKANAKQPPDAKQKKS